MAFFLTTKHKEELEKSPNGEKKTEKKGWAVARWGLQANEVNTDVLGWIRNSTQIKQSEFFSRGASWNPKMLVRV